MFDPPPQNALHKYPTPELSPTVELTTPSVLMDLLETKKIKLFVDDSYLMTYSEIYTAIYRGFVVSPLVFGVYDVPKLEVDELTRLDKQSQKKA
ncbi:hypothetical protein CPB83DRAFT_900787 [Crepidotus variabilis]|uniref:Uncharacterized protein n=1 Tax=Crepidotus variabilis TaxID=179855 RepID=A0A9P6BBF5_9AGAR|nr:hypothetical protein CPB83DRAFT_900787 [Crepidotus variabilis]